MGDLHRKPGLDRSGMGNWWRGTLRSDGPIVRILGADSPFAERFGARGRQGIAAELLDVSDDFANGLEAIRVGNDQEVVVVREEDAPHDAKAGVALGSAQGALDRQVHLRGRSQEEPTLNRPARDLDEMTREQATQSSSHTH